MNSCRRVLGVALAAAVLSAPSALEGQKPERPLDINIATLLEVESSLTSDTTPKVPPRRAEFDSPNIGFLTSTSKRLGTGHSYNLWRMEVWPNRTVYVTVRSTAFDTAIAVFNPENTSIKFENDDFEPSSTDSRIILRASRGEFYILVSSYEPGKTGRYTLHVQQVVP